MKPYYMLPAICILLWLPASLRAQTELSGNVTIIKTGTPMPNASVYIQDLKIGAVTDANGYYDLKNLPLGTYVIEAHMAGYKPKLKTITVHKQENVVTDFTLTSAAYEAQEVVITGNAIATSLQNTPQPVTLIPNSYLQQNAYTNIIDAISQVPGVSAITDGQSIAKPVIRGLGYNRVVVVNDGVRQEGQQWGDEFGIEVDQNSVDRVEILKGPASLVYGSDALNGVINFLPEETLPEGQIKGDIAYNFQTNNGLMNGTAHIAGNIKGLAFSVRVSSIMAHAYQNKYDGYVFNSQFSNFSYDGTLGLHRRWGFSQLHYSFFNLKTGIVEGVRDAATGAFQRQTGVDSTGTPVYTTATNQELKSYTPFLINQNVRHYKLVWDNSIALGNNRLIARLAWQQNRRQENNDITQPNTSNIYYLLNTANYDLRYVANSAHDVSLSIGANGMYQDSKNKGTLLLIPEYSLLDIGAFAIANKKIGDLTISGGIRYDARQFKGHDNYIDSNSNQVSASDPGAIHRFTAYNSDFTGLSASLGATYQLTNSFYIKGNVARGFRAPNVAETGSNGIHDGTVVYEIGVPDLKPESSLEFDISPGFKNKDVNAELDLFSNSISNYIFPKALQAAGGGDSIRNDVPGFPDAPVYKYTQGDALLQGLEAIVDIHPSRLKWLDWYNGFSYVNAYLKNTPDSAKYLPFTPPARLRSELTLSAKKINKAFTNSYLRLGVVITFAQNNLYAQSATYAGLSSYEQQASTSATKGYTLLNAGIGSDIIGHGRKMCSIYIAVTNIANTPYIDYMSRFKYYPVNLANRVNRVGVYNMGTNASIKIVVPLDFKG